MIDVSGFVIGRLVIITRYGTILDEKGTFTIRAQAQDIAGLESEWGTLQELCQETK